MSERSADDFWAASGAAGPLMLRAEGGGCGTTRRELGQPFAVIGRDPKADLSLEHEAISRRHVYLQVVAGRLFWVDLGSRTGVGLGGVLAPSGYLASGETMGVGPFGIEVQEPIEALGPGRDDLGNPLSDRGPTSWPDAVLEFHGYASGPVRWPLRRVLTLVGRVADCRLKIPDEGISRHHCALLRTPSGPWVVDLLSREGIRVDGVRVRAARLGDGEQLHVGRYRVVVRYADPRATHDDTMRPEGVPSLRRDRLPAATRPPRSPAQASKPGELLIEPSPTAGSVVDLEGLVGRLEQMQTQMFDQFHQAMMTMFQAFGAMHRDQMGQVREELDRIRALTGELQALNSASKPPYPGEAPAVSTDAATKPVASSPGTTGEDRDRDASPPRRPSGDMQGSPLDPDFHALITSRIAEIQGERQGRWKRVLDLISRGDGT